MQAKRGGVSMGPFITIGGIVLVALVCAYLDRQRRKRPTGEWRDETRPWPVMFSSGPEMFIQIRERDDGVIEIRKRAPADSEGDYLAHR